MLVFFVFQRQVCLHSSLGGVLRAILVHTVFSISPVRSFHAIHTLRTVCNLSLRVCEALTHACVPSVADPGIPSTRDANKIIKYIFLFSLYIIFLL
jgi:hypothetical protein